MNKKNYVFTALLTINSFIFSMENQIKTAENTLYDLRAQRRLLYFNNSLRPQCHPEEEARKQAEFQARVRANETAIRKAQADLHHLNMAYHAPAQVAHAAGAANPQAGQADSASGSSCSLM